MNATRLGPVPPAPVPVHHHHARLVHAALRHAEQGAEAELRHLVAAPAPRPSRRARCSFLQRLAISAGFSTLAGSLTRSRVRKTPLAHRGERLPGGLRRARRRHAARVSLREVRLVLRLLLGAIAVEAIGAQRRAQRHLRRLRRLSMHRPRRAAVAVARQRGDGVAAGLLQRAGVQVGRLAQADDDDPRQAGARREDGAGLALGALELRRGQGARDGAVGRLVRLLPTGPTGISPSPTSRTSAPERGQRGLWRKRSSSMVARLPSALFGGDCSSVSGAYRYLPGPEPLSLRRMTEILPPIPPGSRARRHCCATARLVAFGTETVYGLGADATNAEAVAGIFAAKGRPRFNPLICHYPDADAAFAQVAANATARRLAAALWPGPLTLVLPRRAGLPGRAADRRRAGHAGGARAGAGHGAGAAARGGAAGGGALGQPVGPGQSDHRGGTCWTDSAGGSPRCWTAAPARSVSNRPCWT